MRVYVASSWRNLRQPAVVAALRAAGHDVYDFRHPAPGDEGFHWSAIDPAWRDWTAAAFLAALAHPLAVHGFALDWAALTTADACVLVLPCGRSAHLELGVAAGAGKRTILLLDGQNEPELMYRLVDVCCTSLDQVIAALADPSDGAARLSGLQTTGAPAETGDTEARRCPA